MIQKQKNLRIIFMSSEKTHSHILRNTLVLEYKNFFEKNNFIPFFTTNITHTLLMLDELNEDNMNDIIIFDRYPLFFEKREENSRSPIETINLFKKLGFHTIYFSSFSNEKDIPEIQEALEYFDFCQDSLADNANKLLYEQIKECVELVVSK